MTYPAFNKIPRLEKLRWSITEKIDGTNGLIYICDKAASEPDDVLLAQLNAVWENTDYVVCAGSRSRWLNPGVKGGDNYGFAAWVVTNVEQLIGLLGAGYHYGEWWGRGIQRRYGQEEKRFTLFDPFRYEHLPQADEPDAGGCIISRAPLLASGTGTEVFELALTSAIKRLRRFSVAAPDFLGPEGVVVRIGDSLHKVIINDGPKELSRDGA